MESKYSNSGAHGHSLHLNHNFSPCGSFRAFTPPFLPSHPLSFPTARFPVSMSLVGAAPQNIPRTWPPARGSPHSLPARQAVTWTTRECAAPAKMLLSARGAWGRSVWDGRWCPEPRWLEGHCPRHTLGHWEELPHSFGAALASHLGSARSREGFI